MPYCLTNKNVVDSAILSTAVGYPDKLDQMFSEKILARMLDKGIIIITKLNYYISRSELQTHNREARTTYYP